MKRSFNQLEPVTTWDNYREKNRIMSTVMAHKTDKIRNTGVTRQLNSKPV